MALLSKKEFATACGMNTGQLSVSINRDKKVNVRGDGMIDTSDEKNSLFLLKRKSKAKENDLSSVTDSVKPEVSTEKAKNTKKEIKYTDDDSEVEVSDDEEKIMGIPESDKKYQHYRALRTQKLAELAQMEIEKQMGLLIDYESVRSLLLIHSKSLTVSFKTCVEGIIDRIGDMYEVGAKDKSQLKRDALEKINVAGEDAISESKKSLKIIVQKFTDKK